MAILGFQVPARHIHTDKIKTGLPIILYLERTKKAGFLIFPVRQYWYLPLVFRYQYSAEKKEILYKFFCEGQKYRGIFERKNFKQ
jgi:hypothetical protein